MTSLISPMAAWSCHGKIWSKLGSLMWRAMSLLRGPPSHLVRRNSCNDVTSVLNLGIRNNNNNRKQKMQSFIFTLLHASTHVSIHTPIYTHRHTHPTAPIPSVLNLHLQFDWTICKIVYKDQFKSYNRNYKIYNMTRWVIVSYMRGTLVSILNMTYLNMIQR